MIISITGEPGAGKSTIAQLLEKELGLKRYYMGAIRRQKAADRGMTIDEYNKLGETDPTTDTEVEDYIEELGRTEDNFVIESRTAFHFIPSSIKVMLTVEKEEGARRIVEHLKEKDANRNESKYQSVEEAVEGLAKRVASDELRYKKYYNIDMSDLNNFDIVVDTTNLTPEQVTQEVIRKLPS